MQHFCEKCGFLRLDLAQKYAEKHGAFKKTGDVAERLSLPLGDDFPMFEWEKDEKRWNPAHHPFTSLHEEDMAKLEANIDSVHDPKSPLGEIRALAYDVVLNGTELGSGSIRIHRQDIQRKIFQALGMSEEEASPLWILSGGAGIRHASARRHRAWAGPHCHDPGRGGKPARGDSVPQDRARGGFDGGRADSGERGAVAGIGNPDQKSVSTSGAEAQDVWPLPQAWKACSPSGTVPRFP